MARKKEDEYNVFGKHLKYTSGLEHWKFECPYCKRIVHIWFINATGEIILNEHCKHYRFFDRARHQGHFVRVKEVRRSKIDKLLKRNRDANKSPGLFDE